MHTPSLIFKNKLHSLCAMIEITDEELKQTEVQVVKREDHVHLDDTNSKLIG